MMLIINIHFPERLEVRHNVVLEPDNWYKVACVIGNTAMAVSLQDIKAGGKKEWQFVNSDFDEINMHFLGPLYIGGLPLDMKDKKYATFEGCIRDVVRYCFEFCLCFFMCLCFEYFCLRTRPPRTEERAFVARMIKFTGRHRWKCFIHCDGVLYRQPFRTLFYVLWVFLICFW